MQPQTGVKPLGRTHIGTSGWHYPHWRGRFYPEKLPASKMLDYYARHFETVELNNTFYRLPSINGVESWRDCTPKDFVFAAKGSRFLTHMKKLTDTGRGIDRFFERVTPLGKKLGPIVFQLPPFWEVNPERLEAFLQALPARRRYAFEFRNPTWHTEPICRILRRHSAAFCIFEIAGFRSAIEITADFTYVRLHGPGAAYQGAYSPAALGRWAKQIYEWQKVLKASMCTSITTRQPTPWKTRSRSNGCWSKSSGPGHFAARLRYKAGETPTSRTNQFER